MSLDFPETRGSGRLPRREEIKDNYRRTLLTRRDTRCRALAPDGALDFQQPCHMLDGVANFELFATRSS